MQSQLHALPPVQHQLNVEGAVQLTHPKFSAVQLAVYWRPALQSALDVAHWTQVVPDSTKVDLHTTPQVELYSELAMRGAVHVSHTALAVALQGDTVRAPGPQVVQGWQLESVVPPHPPL